MVWQLNCISRNLSRKSCILKKKLIAKCFLLIRLIKSKDSATLMIFLALIIYMSSTSCTGILHCFWNANEKQGSPFKFFHCLKTNFTFIKILLVNTKVVEIMLCQSIYPICFFSTACWFLCFSELVVTCCCPLVQWLRYAWINSLSCITSFSETNYQIDFNFKFIHQNDLELRLAYSFKRWKTQPSVVYLLYIKGALTNVLVII